MRIGAAQIPVTNNVQENYKSIIDACDWAVTNNLDLLLTPECALSGYDTMSWNLNTCGPTEEAMEKLKEYSKKTGLAIAVGTLWIYDKDKKVEGNFNNGIHRNQLTFLQDGEVVGYVGKHNVAQCDYNIEPEDRSQTIKIKINDEELNVGVLLCNDLPGNWWDGGDNCARKLRIANVDLILFASNSAKDQGDHIKPMYDDMHNAMLRMAAFGTNCPIISVDNPINIDGVDVHQGTSFTSGIHLPLESLYKAPATGTKYFYYDTKDNSFGEK